MFIKSIKASGVNLYYGIYYTVLQIIILPISTVLMKTRLNQYQQISISTTS